MLGRIDACLAAAADGTRAAAQAAALVAPVRDRLAARITEVDSLDPERVEAAAGRLTALLTQTTAAALLAEQGADDRRKGLVALRYARRHLAPGEVWDDRIAATVGRDLLAFAEVSPAAEAAALAP